jgi:hypothetical protein
MGPDNFIRRDNKPQQPRPHNIQQRPMQRPHAPLVPQRPIRDFQPRTASQQPTQDFRPRDLSPPRPAHPHPIKQQGHSAAPSSLPRQAETHKEDDKKRRLLGFNKLSIAASAGVLLIAVFAFMTLKPASNKAAPRPRATSAPLVNPDFTVYYPTPLASDLSVKKGSIVYSKDSFTFILQQNGQNHFFVYEQPASTDPDLTTLKSKLTAPTNFSLSLGQGLTGGLGTGTITAVKTDKDTIIIVNCTAAFCGSIPQQILSNMHVSDNLDSLRRSNS